MSIAFFRYLTLIVAAATLSSPGLALARSDTAEGGEAASPLANWRVGPVVGKDGDFAYCIAESRFDNGHSLVIARSRQGELNIGLGLPSAHLPKGAAWPVSVVVDDSFSRDRQAVAADPDMLVIANGNDTALFEALAHGSTLAIRGPKDTLTFRLTNTNKALPDLKACVDQARAGRAATPLGSITASSLQLPPLLKQLLAEAGFKKIGLKAATTAPRGLGPADYVWTVNGVTAGMAESRNGRSQGLTNLSDTAIERLRDRCARTFRVTEGASVNLPGGTIRVADAECVESAGAPTYIAFLFELGRAGTFRSFFFEAATSAAAARDRDAVAGVLKQLESH